MKLATQLSVAFSSAGLVLLSATPEAKSLSLTYDRQIGSPGFGPGELFVPQGIGVNPADNNVYISNGRGLNPDGTFNPDLGNRVDIFTQGGEYLGAISSGRQGSGEGLDEPADIKFDPIAGDLYVGDVFNSEIDVYDPSTREYVRSFGSFGGPVEDRIFFGPGGMDFDAQGNLYVSDFSADEIKVYDREGELAKTIGSAGSEPGQFLGPAGLIISENTGRIYVTDQFNNRIQVLDSDGEFLFAFGSEGTGPGQFNEPIGIEVDEFENIYVADSQNGRVQAFDRQGNFLTEFGEPARTPDGEIVPPPALDGPPFGDPLVLEPGVFNWTAGLHYYDSQLYVGDFFQGRVQVLNVEGNDSSAVPEPSTLLGSAVLGLGGLTAKLAKALKHKLGNHLEEF